MAITLRGTTSGNSISADVTLTHPGGIAENDVVYVSAMSTTLFGSDLNMAMVTTGYTELADLYANDAQDTNFGVFRKRMGATPDSTAVVDYVGSVFSDNLDAVEHVLIGVDTTTSEDATTTTATGIDSGTPNPPSITTATANAWVLACAGSTEGDAVSNPPTNYINLIDIQNASTNNVMMASREITSPGAEDPGTYADIVGGTDDSWCAATVAVRPAATGNPTGNGNLGAQAAQISGSGRSKSAGNGSLATGAATMAGSGKVADRLGNGALAAAAATIAGSGRSLSRGNGALAAGVADIDGSGRSLSRGNGSLVSGAATITGSGLIVSATISGNGNLAAGAATIIASGRSFSIGNGALAVANTNIAGSGLVTAEAGPADETSPFVYRSPRRMRAQKSRAA